MALPRDPNNYNIHQNMPDDPWKSGYTAAQMKQICDQAALAIQNFVNNDLIPQIEAQFATQDELAGIVLGQIPDGTLTFPKLAPGFFPVVTATLYANAWVGSAAPYTQTIAVSGLTATSRAEVGLPETATQNERFAAASARLAPTARGTNTLTITADVVKPGINIPVRVIIWG